MTENVFKLPAHKCKKDGTENDILKTLKTADMLTFVLKFKCNACDWEYSSEPFCSASKQEIYGGHGK